jgi:hypothetical protein
MEVLVPMKPNRLSPWLPFGFSVVLSGISLVAYSGTGGSGGWIPAFLAFTHQERAHIEALETRIRQLEAVSPAALNAPTFERPMVLAMDVRAKAVDAA